MSESIMIDIKDLPKEIVACGEDGQKKTYILVPAGRKFGVSLQAPQINK